MATDLSNDVAAGVRQTESPAPASNASVVNTRSTRRRSTVHLKDVPPTLEQREELRGRCARYAATLDKSLPLTKDDMERHSRAILAEAGLPEGFVGWTMVMLSSEFFRDAVAAVPPSRRLFLLPHCLKHAEGCPADYDEFGMDCKRCGACSIADFRGAAEAMGYRVLVAEGSPVVMKIIVSGYVDAIVGVACLNVLEKAIDKILLAGIPCMAVPLLSSDCRNTKVDEQWVSEMVRTPHREHTGQQTRSFIHLMRAASDLFTQPRLTELLKPQRPTFAFDSETSLDQIEPIASSETITADFLARGGKYSRPFITLAAYDAMRDGGATTADGAAAVADYPEHVFGTAMAMEMFHKASLIHDDIEDDDAFRYGAASLHSRFGVPVAINLGDFLIGQGYRMISRSAKDMGPDVAADILDQLAHAHTRLAEGQGAELIWRQRSDKELAPLDALKFYALKTAPAFEVALYSGVRLAGDAAPLAEAIRGFSRNIGVAFQILNDLKDWQADRENKLASGGDVAHGRPTVLYALALQNLPPEERQELLELFVSPAGDATAARQRVARVRRLYDQADVFEQSLRLVDKHQQRAEQIVDAIEVEPLRRLMFYLLDTVLERPSEPSRMVVPILGLPPS